MAWINALVVLPRRYKRALLRLADMLLVIISLLLAVQLVGSDKTLVLVWPEASFLLVTISLMTPLIFESMGVYRIVLRYMNQRMTLTMVSGVLLLTMSLHIMGMIFGQPLDPSTSLVFALLALTGIGGLRLALRELYQLSRRPQRQSVVIYGAGAAGCELAHSLRHGGRYRARAFVDDWRGLEGALVEGLPVYSPSELETLIERLQLELVLLAIPSAPRCRRREILEQLSRLSIPVQTIPGSDDLVSGRAQVSDTCNVAVEDLLGRDPVPPFEELMTADILGKVVMVTGAGGSIGSELCRQILAQRPASLLLVDNCEYALYAIEQELERGALQRLGSKTSIKTLLVSVQHGERMREIMRSFDVHTLYHAAAYKHVPMVETNLVEGIRNNVFGTLGLVLAAEQTSVETFVMVSTDKAVRPTNVMGASKRLTELICQARAAKVAEGGARTRFCMVRFGNVLGSSGSVVPLFQRQIERGGPVEVTHPDITRYFMTIPEAAQLVIQAGAMSVGGEVFVLDMAQPVRIADLATSMIRLSGLEVKDDDHPDGDIEIVYTGLRPGEKLYEELLLGDEIQATRHPRIKTSREVHWEWERLEAFLGELNEAIRSSDYLNIHQLLKEAPLEYSPGGSMADLVWLAQRMPVPKEPVASHTEINTPEDIAKAALNLDLEIVRPK